LLLLVQALSEHYSDYSVLCCAVLHIHEVQVARGKRKKGIPATAADANDWTIVKRLKAVGNFLFAKFK
jgi:hypothetical protein